jgi:hypothetical protein
MGTSVANFDSAPHCIAIAMRNALSTTQRGSEAAHVERARAGRRCCAANSCMRAEKKQ